MEAAQTLALVSLARRTERAESRSLPDTDSGALRRSSAAPLPGARQIVSGDSGWWSAMASGSGEDIDREGDLGIAEERRVKRPRRYVVVFHNDDYTTQEFVVHVLVAVFHKDTTAATQIMLEVHHKGHGIVGVYSRDVAETKVAQVLGYAKKHGHPLKVTAEPEGYGGHGSDSGDGSGDGGSSGDSPGDSSH